MNQKNVVVTIAADGSVDIEANNFHGQGCLAATKDLQKVLAGGGDVETDKKPEFWQSGSGKGTTTQ